VIAPMIVRYWTPSGVPFGHAFKVPIVRDASDYAVDSVR
jgi:hypothetical protein